MRTSSKRTTAAVLRSIIGVKDIEMAELLKCSPQTIHSVESGRLKLSEDLARRMSHETGIALFWLLFGNVKVAPTTEGREPFTRESFERHRASKYPSTGSEFSTLDSLSFYGQLRAILAGADKRGDYALAAYKAAKAIASLAAEFGRDEKIYSGDANLINVPELVALVKADAAQTKGYISALADDTGRVVVAAKVAKKKQPSCPRRKR